MLRIFNNQLHPIIYDERSFFVTDTIYPARFKHVEELKHMGANIYSDEGTATIKPSHLKGAEVYASDLRAGACLITAGLIAEV